MRPADPATGEMQAGMGAWHAARARAELDAAYRSAGPKEAAIHFRLSALHMEHGGWAAAGPETDWIGRMRPLHERALGAV
jgi:hypothetical protein